MVSPEPQLVDADGMVVELAEQRSLLVAEAKLGRVADGWLVGCGVDLADQRAKFLEDVVDHLDQAGAVTDQAVAAAAGQASNRAGHGEDLPVLLHGVVRGGQQPAPRRGLDDHDAQAKAGNDPVALREPVYLAIGSDWRSSLVRPTATDPTRAAPKR